MGQGQEIHARHQLKSAISQGSWVLLQNCHLCLEYIQEVFELLSSLGEPTEHPTEEKEVEGNEDSEVVHDHFRLWVTAETHEDFPMSFLQVGIKFTNEPPEGIRANLSRRYHSMTQDFLEICVTHHWRVMLYALAYLHCTVQERRKYGPLGWCVPYEFNQSDFLASVNFIQNHLDSLPFRKGQKTSVSQHLTISLSKILFLSFRLTILTTSACKELRQREDAALSVVMLDEL